MLNEEWDYILSHDIRGWPQNVPRDNANKWTLSDLLNLAKNVGNIQFIIKKPRLSKAKAIKRHTLKNGYKGRIQEAKMNKHMRRDKMLLHMLNMIEEHFQMILEEKLGYNISEVFWGLLDLDDLENYPLLYFPWLNSEKATDSFKDIFKVYKQLNYIKLKDDNEKLMDLDLVFRKEILNQKICQQRGEEYVEIDFDGLKINPAKDIKNWPSNNSSGDQETSVDLIEFILMLDPITFDNLEFTNEFLDELEVDESFF